MDLIHPSKGTAWRNGLKSKIPQYVVYRRPISPTEISTGFGWKAGRDLPSQWPQKQARVATLITDKEDFIHILIKRDKGQSILIKGEIDQKK
jgi:hypothetical protein